MTSRLHQKNNPHRQRFPILKLGLAFALILGTVFTPFKLDRAGWTPSQAQASFFNKELEIFEEVLDLVADKYVYPPDYKKLFHSVIDAMISLAPENAWDMTDHGDGKTISSGKDKLTYHLNYSYDDNLRSARKVFRFLLKHHPDVVKEEQLETIAIHGIMSSLDAYSLYMNPEDFENSMRDTEGQYGGLGIVITLEDLKLTIVKTMKGSPAEEADLLPGDIITHVNGEEIKGMQIQELATRLRGPPNTQVDIRTLRPKTGKKSSHTMTRRIINIASVEFKWLQDDTAYIKITSFSKQTNEQLEAALEKAKERGMRALVLDLRGNPGGLLNQSVLVASHFLEEGRLIVYTRGRHVRDSQEYDSMFSQSLHRLPVAILIDGHSASASEIVAGSLRDSGKAILIGDNSYGKGSVQTIFRMSDGSGLRLTTSKYFTPSGIDITEQGITPEIKIEQDLPPGPGVIQPSKRNKTKRLNPRGKPLMVKQSEIRQYLKSKGVTPDRELDAQVHLARIVLKNSKPTRSHTLAKARELVQDMHY